MNKLKLWKETPSWSQAEKNWDLGAREAAKQNPLKGLSQLPNMVGMTPETAKNLKWKSLKWLIQKDEGAKVFKKLFRHPFKYGFRYLKSLLKSKSYKREGDFFFYGIESVEHFQKFLEEEKSLLILGFSYCHKPFECPSGRFTDQCIHKPENSICRQCFIGKAVNALPEKRSIPLFIPTIHYIGEKLVDIVQANPKKKVLFIITACEMTLEMFGDWGNMLGVKGIGVRLDGRICNTMKAFELSEQGIKPGLTVVLESTQRQILDLLHYHWVCTKITFY